MDSRVTEVNRTVTAYDRELFAQREQNGAVHVYRRTRNSTDPYYMVFALTDTWTASGKPVPWGLTVIEARLRAIDLWKDETVVDRVQKMRIGEAEARERDMRNSTEAFLYDFRKQFAKATDGINTGSLAKLDRRAKMGA